MRIIKKYSINIDDAINQLKKRNVKIGCVYPEREQSYFINSNINCNMSYINCLDGAFFCENTEESNKVIDGWKTIDLKRYY